MAKTITPRWFAPRSCFRVRKTIGPHVKTYYGGHGATGPADESAMARARVEIENAIVDDLLQARSAIKSEMASASHLIRRLDDLIRLEKDAQAASGSLLANITNPELAKAPAVLDQLRSAEKENQSQYGQLRSLARSPLAADGNLQDLQTKYTELTRQQGKTEGKHASTINEYARSSLLLVQHLRANGIDTTAQLDRASAIVAEYRDDWIQQISEGQVSKGLARRMLLGARLYLEWLLARDYLTRLPPAVDRKWATVGMDEAKPTYLTIKECRMLYSKAPERLKLMIALGLNCGYRHSDLLSLRRQDIDLKAGTIKRQRSKTGKAQAHKLWPVSRDLLRQHLAQVEGEPFAVSYSNASKELTEYMQAMVPQKPDKRTAKTLRSTGANELEKLLKGKHPHLVSQYLAHGDKAIARHYRDEETAGLFEALDRLGRVFGLEGGTSPCP